jgi:putative Ca2+/H+ antiporter (TMEM165/GDT1 family)
VLKVFVLLILHTGGFIMKAFLNALLFVSLAEMGDKSQLLTMTFACKYKIKHVIPAITIAILLLNTIAVAVGSILGSIINFSYIQIAAALSFIAFGLLSVKPEKEEDAEGVRCVREDRKGIGAIIAMAGTFFLSEFGDKTQLMTLTMSAQFANPTGILLGSTFGMLIADGLGIVGGTFISKYIPERFIKWGSAAIFLVFGILTLYKAVPENLHRTVYLVPLVIVILVLVYFIGFRSGKRKDTCSVEKK